MYKFLIADDSAVARSITKKIIENSGYKVVAEAESGEKAVIQYRIFKPDIVALDYDMPGMGGLEAAKTILNFDATARVIFITAHDITDAMNGFESDNVITKPLTQEKLNQKIEKLFPPKSKGEQSTTLNSINAPLTTKNIQTPNNDVKNPEEIPNEANHDNPFNIQSGHSVAVTHFSGEKPHVTSIVKYLDNVFTLKITKEFISIVLTETDPISIAFEGNDDSYICECAISQINYKNKTFDATMISKLELSKYQATDRLPVSLYIEIRDPNSDGKNNIAHIKNINQDCMSIYTRLEYAIGDSFMFDMFIGTNIVSLGAKVTSIVKHNTHFEYDFDISYYDYSKKSFIRMFVEKNKKDQEDAINKLKEIHQFK